MGHASHACNVLLIRCFRPYIAGKLRVEIQERVGQGRGLVSLGNEPNEVLLSLPYDTVFMDTEVIDARPTIS